MLLTQIEISNYRSLEKVKLEGLGQLNVLVGPNNSGKSSVFGALEFLNNVIHGRDVEPDRVLTDGDLKRSFAVRLRFDVSDGERSSFLGLIVPTENDARRIALEKGPFLRRIEYLFSSAAGQPSRLPLRDVRILTEDSKWVSVQRYVGPENQDNPESAFLELNRLKRFS